MTDNSLRTPLGRARGLGSAKGGTDHWWLSRLTSIALVPLSLWFVLAVLHLLGADLATVRAWVASPTVAAALVLFVAVGVQHAVSGIQVVVEDYVHDELVKLAVIIVEKFVLYALAVASIIAVLKISFGG